MVGPTGAEPSDLHHSLRHVSLNDVQVSLTLKGAFRVVQEKAQRREIVYLLQG